MIKDMARHITIVFEKIDDLRAENQFVASKVQALEDVACGSLLIHDPED